MLQSSLGQAQRFKKRERTQNWAYEEKHFLLELCRKDMHIIENKRLDSALTTLKNRAWKIIHQQFAIAFGTDRNCNRLKEQWRRMKACTRAEMLDYQQRIQRFGQDVADRKKPSQFTFEIWEFMQEAKKVCKNELMDDVDYSKIKLSLEENLPQGVSLKDCSDENDDESSSMWEKTSQNICEVQIKEDSQDELEDYEKGSSAKYPRLRGFSNASTPFGPVTSAVEATAHSRFNELLASSFASRLASEHHLNNNNNNNNNGGNSGGGHCNNNNNSSTGSGNKLLVDAGLDLYNRTAFGSESSLVDLGTSGPANLSQLDLSNTLEALNLLKTRFNRISQLGQWKNAFQEAQNLSTSSNNNPPPPPDSPTGSGGHNHHAAAGSGPELVNGVLPVRGGSPPLAPTTVGSAARSLSRCIEVEQQQHQQSEHDLRMEILRTDLATAKINKETAELNRQLVLQKLRRVHPGIGSRGGAPAEEDGVGDDGGSSTNNISNPSTTDCRVVRSPTSLASVSVVPSPSPPLALRVVKTEEHFGTSV